MNIFRKIFHIHKREDKTEYPIIGEIYIIKPLLRGGETLQKVIKIEKTNKYQYIITTTGGFYIRKNKKLVCEICNKEKKLDINDESIMEMLF